MSLALLVALLLVEVAALVQCGLQIQGPVNKPNGLCATFVLSQGLDYACEEYVVRSSLVDTGSTRLALAT